MKRFWVEFTHDFGRNRVAKAMSGPTPRHIAAEIRREYVGVDIESISTIANRTSSTFRVRR